MPLFRRRTRAEELRKFVEELMQATFEANWSGGQHAIRLAGADLRDADLSNLNLYVKSYGPVDLSDADLTGAVLEGVNLNDALMRDAVLVGIRGRGLIMNGADLTRTDFTDADLRESSFNNAVLDATLFRRSDLRGARGFYRAGSKPPRVESCIADDEYFLTDKLGPERYRKWAEYERWTKERGW